MLWVDHLKLGARQRAAYDVRQAVVVIRHREDGTSNSPTSPRRRRAGS
jgi:hypothetical protein